MNKHTISIYNAQIIVNSNQQTANAINKQNKVNKEISDNEIKSKNRVDISLEEYEKSKQELFQDTIINNIFNETCEKFQKQKTEAIDNFIKTNLKKLGCNVENEEETATFIEENNIRLEWIRIEESNAWGIILYKDYKLVDEFVFNIKIEVK